MRGSELPVASLGLRPGTYSVSDGRDEKQKNPTRLNQVWIVWVLLLIVTMEMDGPLFYLFGGAGCNQRVGLYNAIRLL
ncbi:hypothetical protein V8C44DRAFT_315529 [Trichoderma aethiopicum]